LEVAFPFYGDKLDEFARQRKLPLTTDVQAKGIAADHDFLAFQAEVAEAIRLRAGITDNQISAEYGTNPLQKGPENWAWVQAIVRAIDKYGGGMSQSAIEAFMRDVYLYTTH